MKVLHLIGSVDRRTGGPIEGVLQQATRQADCEDLTHIASLDHPDDPWVASCPVQTFALGSRNSAYLKLWRFIPWLRYGYTPDLVPWLRAHTSDYDIVVVNGLWNYSALAARRVLGDGGVPYVVFTHGMLDPWFRKTYPLKHVAKQIFWWFSEGPLLAHARATFFTSNDERQLARGSFWPYRCREKVVGYGSADLVGDPQEQIDAFRSAVPISRERKFLLFLSRIHRKKGCDLLIEAFAKVAPGQPDLDLVIAGPDQEGWQDDLQAKTRALGIADRVYWPGMITGDAKWGAYRACEAFVLPSHQENFGIVVAEAMAAGRPVLITNKVNIWREVDASGGGLVAEDELPGICNLLERYFTMSPEQRKLMGENARQGFLRNFEMRRVFATIDQALREAIAQ